MFKFGKVTKNANRTKNKKRLEARLARLRMKYVEPFEETQPAQTERVQSELQAGVDIGDQEDELVPHGGGDWQEAADLFEEPQEENEAGFAAEHVAEVGSVLRTINELEVEADQEQSAQRLQACVERRLDEDEDEETEHALDADDISQFFVSLQAKREVSKAVIGDIVKFLRRNGSDVGQVLKEGELPSFKVMRHRVQKRMPKINVVVVCIDGNGARVELAPRTTFPKKEILRRNLKVEYTLFYVSLKDVRTWHIRAHPKKRPEALSKQFDCSLDGVPESRSSGLSIDLLSIRFINCRNIYTFAILQPSRKRLGNKDAIVLQPFLEELKESGLTLRYFIADAPKRASLQGLKSHSANHGCPYCLARKEDGHYAASSMNKPRRTDAELRERARAVSEGRGGEIDDGVRAVSLLEGIEDFDIINDVPAESMHLCFLGVVRKMMKLMYKQVGVTNKFRRYRAEYRPVSEEPLNRELEKVKGLSSFSRRPRDFDAAVYKAEEYRNIALAFWPAVLSTCPLGTRQAWLRTVYSIRGFSLPNSIYNDLKVNTNFGAKDLREWYIDFEEAFGVEACSHNIHVFHHLDLVRALGLLSTTSAVHYEDHYSLVKVNYKAGTISKGKQALESLFLAQASGHACAKKRKVQMRETSKVDDRYVYLKDGRIILLTEMPSARTIVGRRVPTKNVPNLLEERDFSDVLVFRADQAVLAESVTARVADVLGLVVFCQEFASVLTWSMLEM